MLVVGSGFNLPPFLCSVVFVSETSLGPGLDFQGVGLRAIDTGKRPGRKPICGLLTSRRHLVYRIATDVVDLDWAPRFEAVEMLEFIVIGGAIVTAFALIFLGMFIRFGSHWNGV